MLYFVFTVDGDWEEYYDPKLSEEERAPNLEKLLSFIDKEISAVLRIIDGKFIHFVHTSPRARDFFLASEFIARWKKIEEHNGSIGIHCHEDDPRKAYYFDDKERMEKAIGYFTTGLRQAGISPLAYRGGYMAFSPGTIPLLEKNKIYLDFSCEPGRYLIHGEKMLVSDWRGSPYNYYRMDYTDHRKPGNSRVFEVPIGSALGGYLYIELSSIIKMWNIARILKRKAKTHDILVSVLAHSFEFGYFLKVLKIKLALSILKKYANFINAQEALAIVNKK
jgi:hypothetical protein